MTKADCPNVLVINPLKYTLAHYESELIETINRSAYNTVETAETVPGDGIAGPYERIAVAARAIWERIRMGRTIRGKTVIVIWPMFGYFEPATLIGLSRHNNVYIVIHDPSPLRRTYGQSVAARKLFKKTTERWNIKVIYHTVKAQRVGTRDNGVSGIVIPHPIRSERPLMGVPRENVASRPKVRVLGQYKRTRSLEALTTIADRTGDTYQLEIYGRGWPDVPGWKVANEFVPEQEFVRLVESSDCVVIPYDLFFQSNVAVRCLEAGVPVVAPVHEHITQLYGEDWPGTVRDPSDWYDALSRALAVDLSMLRSHRLGVTQQIRSAWDEGLATGGSTTTFG
ncbi:hypothetical protein D8S82_17170 [Mycobacterium hodleri]|uniref:Glycosyltransferase n=1 Tax=Mycolicibacterium hodleri TaxID=49897 RepID=A0A544VZE9_9MYCO|nr:hypothetical protein [Mycolicibacterium hodleri]TQR85361.1 hypothetical protein D8S82_17170 [Mycolicibacterium hodleri]